MKFIDRLKVAFGLMFSSKYIDDLNDQIRSSKDEKDKIEKEYTQAAECFNQAIKLIEKSEKQRYFSKYNAIPIAKIAIPNFGFPEVVKTRTTSPPARFHFDEQVLSLQQARYLYQIGDCLHCDLHGEIASELGRKLIEEGFVNIEHLAQPYSDACHDLLSTFQITVNYYE
ncbi:hypothetical protein [Bacteroides sp. 224]|uniref:hypothetical protein n=1 Tax=Bacteroides sp. 224 TaxID=2302936 RepID=UPI0013CFEACB|nr:hypothetical protein [Bacteroides sp. 224]NDV63969.1 hypothetical protein [Bacteroides sp. 224]